MKRNKDGSVSRSEVIKLLKKLPVEKRRVLIRRAQFKVINGGRDEKIAHS